MINSGFGTNEVLDTLNGKAEEEGGEVEFDGNVATCYDANGEEVARVNVYNDGEAGGSVASVGYDEGGYSEALEGAVEGVKGVGFSRSQIAVLDPVQH